MAWVAIPPSKASPGDDAVANRSGERSSSTRSIQYLIVSTSRIDLHANPARFAHHWGPPTIRIDDRPELKHDDMHS
jgi:hypothetical protein